MKESCQCLMGDVGFRRHAGQHVSVLVVGRRHGTDPVVGIDVCVGAFLAAGGTVQVVSNFNPHCLGPSRIYRHRHLERPASLAALSSIRPRH